MIKFRKPTRKTVVAVVTSWWFIGLIGVLGIVKGVLIYFNPGGLFEISKDWVETFSDQGYRLVGIIALVLGTVVISWIQ